MTYIHIWFTIGITTNDDIWLMIELENIELKFEMWSHQICKTTTKKIRLIDYNFQLYVIRMATRDTNDNQSINNRTIDIYLQIDDGKLYTRARTHRTLICGSCCNLSNVYVVSFLVVSYVCLLYLWDEWDSMYVYQYENYGLLVPHRGISAVTEPTLTPNSNTIYEYIPLYVIGTKSSFINNE